ncbi:MAG: C_GCAxxG_C_C family protein [Theionarchaea archaeon]|nr:C_GCAxxG_C_C family protein [Theionarchaea archaeon]
MGDPVKYFDSGFNCAESVLLSLSEVLGNTSDCIPQIATGFGGGMRTGDICGAVSGAVMGLGLHFGRTTSEEKEKRDNTYAVVEEFVRQFRKIHGTIICRELLGVDVTTEEGRAQYEKDDLHHQKCHAYCATAFKIAETLLSPE